MDEISVKSSFYYTTSGAFNRPSQYATLVTSLPGDGVKGGLDSALGEFVQNKVTVNLYPMQSFLPMQAVGVFDLGAVLSAEQGTVSVKVSFPGWSLDPINLISHASGTSSVVYDPAPASSALNTGGFFSDGVQTASEIGISPAISGPIGGPISIVTSATAGGPFDPAASQYTAAIVVEGEQIYAPKSTIDYIKDELRTAVVQNPGASDYDVAEAALSHVITMRESDAQTSSQNLNLRDAEYFLRGYAGGLADVQGQQIGGDANLGTFVSELGNRGGPAAWIAYAGLKFIATVKQDVANVLSGDGLPTGTLIGTNGLPSSPIGGFTQNAVGFEKGLANYTVQDILNDVNPLSSHLLDAVFGDQSQVNIDSNQQLFGAPIGQPLLPSNAAQPSFTITGPTTSTSFFDVNISEPTKLAYFDPSGSDTYSFAAQGNSYSGLLVPKSLSSGPVILDAGGREFSIAPDQYFDLHAAGLSAVSSLALSVQPGASPLVVGFTFDVQGATTVAETQTAVDLSSIITSSGTRMPAGASVPVASLSAVSATAQVVAGQSTTGSAGVAGTGVLAGEGNPNGGALAVSAIQSGAVGQPVAGTYGLLTLNADGSYSYTADNLLAVSEAQAANHVFSQIELTGTAADIAAVQQAASTVPLHDRFNFIVSDGKGGSAASTLDIAVTVQDEGTPNSDVTLPGPGSAITVVHYDAGGLLTSVTQRNPDGSVDSLSYSVTPEGKLVPVETHQPAPGAGSDGPGATAHASDLSVPSGSQVDLGATGSTIGALVGSGTLTSTTSDANLTLSPAAGSSSTFAGQIKEASGHTISLTLDSPGMQVLANTNTYSGPTTIKAGTLTLQHATAGSVDAVGSGIVALQGGTLSISTGQGATLTNGLELGASVSAGGTIASMDPKLVLAGEISGAGSLTLTGTEIDLTHNNPNFTGTVYLNSGTMVLGTPGALGSAVTAHLVDPTIKFAATGTYASPISLDVAAAGSGAAQTTASDPAFMQIAGGITATLTGQIMTGSGANALGFAIDQSQPLVISGLGVGATLVLSGAGANSYMGGTTLQGSITLDLAKAGAAGTGGISFTGSGQTLQIETAAVGSDSGHTLANQITGFAAGDVIDLSGIGSATGATYDAVARTLTIASGTQTETLNINAAPAGYQYSVAADGRGGTQLTLNATVASGGGGGDGSTPTSTGAEGGGAGGPGLVPDPTHAPYFGSVAHDASSPGGEIYALYHGLLGRDPDLLGLEGHAAEMQAGLSLSDLAQAFIASPEYQANHSADETSTAFVQGLYRDLLLRDAEPDGLVFFTTELGHGMSQGQVVAQIATSAEAQHLLQEGFTSGIFVPDAAASEVARLYHGLLGRAPDASGLQAFAGGVQHGAGLSDVAQAMITSPEYMSAHADLSDAAFVESLYSGALGRNVDAAGATFFADELAHGTSRAAVALAIAESPEAQCHLLSQIEAGWHLVG
ncbi:DUF4214 domain-containing protein [Methylobacterium nigriterrae]|uniref:DUF4214 domain-containing protein n=1 Tax=Methylobacterium nigriterrae TaxID=3127512 RepID=UPI0030137938